MGVLDIVTANSVSSNVSVLRNDGLGGFTASTTGIGTGSPVPRSAPNTVALGDVNGDGKLDIVTANYLTKNVSVLLGDGLGGFTASTKEIGGVPSNPTSVTLGDVNSDGKLDIVTVNSNVIVGNASVLLGDGTGGFTAHVYDLGVGVPSSVALGDLNSDGWLDIATATNDTSRVRILLGDGTGGFTVSTSGIGVGPFPVEIALGDLNGDGKLDIVTANSGSNDVSVLLGDGLGGFTVSAMQIAAGNRPLPDSVALGDVNGDGKLDIVTANLLTDNVSVLVNNGLGGFTASTRGIGGGDQPRSVALGDVNGDGKLDIVTANGDPNTPSPTGTVSVLLGDGLGNFTASLHAIGGGFGPNSVALGEVFQRNDAPVNHLTGPFLTQTDTDLAIAGFSVSDVDSASGILATTLSVAHGTLTVGSAGGAAVTGSGSGAVTLTGTVAQIDTTLGAFHNVVYHGAAYFYGFDVLTMTTNDNGNTGSGGPLGDIDHVNIQVEPLVAGGGDFNGDHSGDYLLRRVDGTFQIQSISADHVSATILGNVGPEWRFYGAGDFNGDHTSDYLVQRDSDHLLQIQEISSNHVASFTFLGQVGAEWQTVSIGDFNGDHTDDFLMQRGDGTLRIYDINNYQVTSAPFLGQVGTEWHFQGVGDFNGDGTSDLLWRRDDGTVRIYDIVNNQVANTQIVGQVGNEWHIVGIGDFNGDHTSDLLWQRGDGTLRIYDIVNNQVTSTQIVETLAPDTHVVGFQDYTGDGVSDLLLRHDDGTFQLQHIANNLVTQTVNLGAVGTEWPII